MPRLETKETKKTHKHMHTLRSIKVTNFLNLIELGLNHGTRKRLISNIAKLFVIRARELQSLVHKTLTLSHKISTQEGSEISPFLIGKGKA